LIAHHKKKIAYQFVERAAAIAAESALLMVPHQRLRSALRPLTRHHCNAASRRPSDGGKTCVNSLI
jgi:hypothetical protein